MSGYLYFSNNLKDIIDHMLDHIVSCKIFFTIKGNSFQRKHELITTHYLFQQPFACNWSSIHLRTNWTVQNWSNNLENFITILYDFEKQWLSTFAWKAILVRPVQQNFICLVEDRFEIFYNEKKCNDRFNLAYVGWNG